jgi:FtsP/CotA-like multicopper oxidase with cupredoxin domain
VIGRRGEPLSRRRFLHLAAAAAAGAAGGGMALLSSCGDAMGPGEGDRSPLAMPTELSATGASLTPAPGVAAIAAGLTAHAWLFNEHMPRPTIRARRDGQARIRLVNRLPEPTIVHWHGVIVPEVADGHPRFAIDSGATYDYEFPLVQRAGTYWYHPHPHHRTAGQIHRGLAGFFIVSDGEPGVAFGYDPTNSDLHTGILRDVPFGNGVRRPTLTVSGARYRFRVLNASQARVYRLALDSGTPLTVIGNDGGLLPRSAEVDSVFLGIGERIDFVVDFAPVPLGKRLMLKSLPFTLPAAPGTHAPQGAEMDLLELVRRGAAGESEPPLPATLSSVPSLGGVVAERHFVLRSTEQDEMHQINGRAFAMDRVDETIPLGQVERWIFLNESALPHPVHLHGTQFQVEARIGGRNTVFPYEAGWKDTVLVMPLETVAVRVVFDRYGGVFPLHCHNLQHEDLGMMLNVEVV